MHVADVNALGARLGWLPSFPSFDRSTLDLADEAGRAGRDVADHVVDELRSGRLRFACEDPDAPGNHPKVMTVWRANLLGSSGKGHEYFLKHLLGTTESAVRAEESPPELRPRDVTWHEQAPEGKLDLLTTIDFRMTSNALFSDVVLPAATWYEKHDLSSTDLHPFVHTFNEAVPPPWENRDRLGHVRAHLAALLRAGRAPPRRAPRRDRRAARRTTPPTRSPSRSARCATGAPASASRSPAARCPS